MRMAFLEARTPICGMAQGGLGLGFGVKDFRAVFIFDDQAAMDKFMVDGWTHLPFWQKRMPWGISLP